ncbi:T9SS type B sorting domain-containing protein [Paucihalobacter ruber]|uniref:T9SS type B sorting domain-containing protein n=1 Tax=Paucihalobacter ruber TaxID=2567861 RepID=A0A506PPA1_9FLAO|nr:T9SS type B sorting domain-containing protein [Paucihalobacter ruber]TPV35045.1 T9SS type B sorting domain-containing protein [Paucihalobacter ruber]
MKLFLTFSLFFILGYSNYCNAQLGFCSGNSGAPIFTETFGAGSNFGPPLPAGTTTYQFVSEAPQDGQYTIASNSGFFDWHNTGDRTPGDTNGKMLIVNADFTAGEFFRITVSGLCQGTSYEFSSWVLNLLPISGCGGNGIPINVGFQIWDSTDSVLLASGNTGPVGGTVSPVWNQYALVFQTEPGQTEVILKMINNGQGGCGNDLAIDDIVFKSCGDAIDITDNNNSDVFLGCSNTATNLELTANPDFAVFQTHAYQWQMSNDGNNWSDISGENNQSYTANPAEGSTFYRVTVAEDAANLQNELCNVISDVFEFTIEPPPDAPISNGDITDCGTDEVSLTVNVPNNILVNWFDAPTGGNLIASNTAAFITNVPGTYYSESVTQRAGCSSLSRTAVKFTRLEPLNFTDETIYFCEGEQVTLGVEVENNVSYIWSTGETLPQITVAAQGTYSVDFVNANGCEATKNFELFQINTPVISEVITNGFDIEIITSETGDFSYSIDGQNFQYGNIFYAIPGGRYTITVRENLGCGEDVVSHLHFVIPKFFTPNNDGFNDFFEIRGIQEFGNSEVNIFDRFGKLLKSYKNSPVIWDGSYLGSSLPTNDYWYQIIIDGEEFNGHFTLKR